MSHPGKNAHPRQNERVAYHNGHILPESEVLISFRDRGFLFGDAVFDTARTFAHKSFRLEEHVDRLFHSIDCLRIDPGLTPADPVAISEEVLQRNLHLIDKQNEYWLIQRISGPPLSLDRDTAAVGKPTVIVECQPLPLTPGPRTSATGSRSWCRRRAARRIPSARRPKATTIST
jgi:branched-chain amino acid aminotransferase